jgi:hypothetical protein
MCATPANSTFRSRLVTPRRIFPSACARAISASSASCIASRAASTSGSVDSCASPAENVQSPAWRSAESPSISTNASHASGFVAASRAASVNQRSRSPSTAEIRCSLVG